jgi:hypothetical protein
MRIALLSPMMNEFDEKGVRMGGQSAIPADLADFVFGWENRKLSARVAKPQKHSSMNMGALTLRFDHVHHFRDLLSGLKSLLRDYIQYSNCVDTQLLRQSQYNYNIHEHNV